MQYMAAVVTGLAVAGNTLNLAYNVPLVWRVVSTGSAGDISTYFLGLRVAGSVCGLTSSSLTEDMWIMTSYLVTLASSVAMLAVKLRGSGETVDSGTTHQSAISGV